MENLAFSVNNVFLKIKSDILGNAEIFHGIGYQNSKLITDPEKMIYPGLACENNGGKIKNIDLLMPEIL
jgi:hypothetical protein